MRPPIGHKASLYSGGRVLAALLLAISLGGCLGNPDIHEFVESVAWEIEPAELEPVHEIRLGRSVLGLAGFALSFADETDFEEQQARALIQDLDAVHIGVYEIHGRRSALHMSEDWRLDLEEDGWIPIIRAQDGQSEAQWVFARMERGELQALTVISIDGRELAIVKLEGRLERSLDYAVRRDSVFMDAARDVGEEL
jgi:Domain of unknown function (DUF4252)